MAVAYDAFSSNSGAGYATTFTHTPAGTPRGVIVFVLTSTAEPVSAMTYGGVSMSLVRSADGIGENAGGRIEEWFLGAGLPTGAQSIVVTGPTSGSPTITAVTVTATGDVEVIDSDFVSSASVANPSNTLTTGGRTVFAALSGLSGVDAVGSITPLANWTSRQEEDYGAVVQFTYTYNTIGTSNVTAGVTQAADDMLMVSIAVSEVIPPATKDAVEKSITLYNWDDGSTRSYPQPVSAPTPLPIFESFENPNGYDNALWYDEIYTTPAGGSIDPDYDSDPIAGNESLQMVAGGVGNTGSFSGITHTGVTALYTRFRFRIDDLTDTTSTDLFTWWNGNEGAPQVIALLTHNTSGGQIGFSWNNEGESAKVSITPGQEYYAWVYIESGTGNAWLKLSTTSTEPGSNSITVTTHTYTGNIVESGPTTLRESDSTAVYDDIWYSTDPIGSSPPPTSLTNPVTLWTPHGTADYRIEAEDDIASGDQIQVRGEGGGDPPSGLVVNKDGTIFFLPGNSPASFDARVSQDNGSTWGEWATQTVESTGTILTRILSSEVVPADEALRALLILRELSDAVMPSDETLRGIVHASTQGSTLTVTDVLGPSGLIRGAVATSLVALFDEQQRAVLRTRLLDSTVPTLTDEQVRNILHNAMAESSTLITDALADTHMVRGAVATSQIAITDEQMLSMLRVRLLEAGIELTDEALAQLAGGQTVITKILTSQILAADEVLPQSYRHRLLESPLETLSEALRYVFAQRILESLGAITDEVLAQVISGTVLSRIMSSEVVAADEALRALVLLRELSDAVMPEDEAVRQLRRFLLLDSSLMLEDSASYQFVADQVFAPRIVIGTAQPAIVLGSDQPAVIVGGYAA